MILLRGNVTHSFTVCADNSHNLLEHVYNPQVTIDSESFIQLLFEQRDWNLHKQKHTNQLYLWLQHASQSVF
jgi:hypothetical protein